MQTKVKNISPDVLWQYPFGTSVKITEKDVETLQTGSPGSYVYTAKDEDLGELLINEFGEQVWLSGEIEDEITIFTDELEDSLPKLLSAIGHYSLSLQEEPIMHAQQIAYLEVMARNVKNLENIINGEV